MKVREILKKSFFMMIMISMVVTAMPLSNVQAAEGSITVSNPSPSRVEEGESIVYTVTYNNAAAIYLYASNISTWGFTADVSINTVNSSTRQIVLDNIQGSVGYKTIEIAANTARDTDGNFMGAKTDIPSFVIEESATPVVVPTDVAAPSMSCSSASTYEVDYGKSTSFTITYDDASAISAITLDKSDISFSGFTASVSVTSAGTNKRKITFSNIKGTAGKKVFAIAAGTAEDEHGNVTGPMPVSYCFELQAKPSDPDPVDPKPTKPDDWVPNPNTGK